MRKLIAPVFLFLVTSLSAQKGSDSTLDIRTSTVCDMCEKTIETELIYEKGVRAVDVDLSASTIHVTYDARRTDPAHIRAAVSKLGYQADDVPADPEAFKRLPACCQKEGCGQPKHD